MCSPLSSSDHEDKLLLCSEKLRCRVAAKGLTRRLLCIGMRSSDQQSKLDDRRWSSDSVFCRKSGTLPHDLTRLVEFVKVLKEFRSELLLMLATCFSECVKGVR